MVRVRFAPSPTGYLHIGSARTYIFNWLYARQRGGTVILRIDDTDLLRNTEESLASIYDGLNWLGLGWDEEYRQSERQDSHVEFANRVFESGNAYRDFTPASDEAGRSREEGPWLSNPGIRELRLEESNRRASAGEPFVLRFRVPRDPVRSVEFTDGVYGTQSKSTADIEDFALLRSNGGPTYHLASCADDAALSITHIIRGQDHLTNTFKHILLIEAAGAQVPEFTHLPLLVAPDGAKLSKRRHGAVVAVSTYRERGFLPIAYTNFLCLLGWSPKDDREYLTLEDLVEAFSIGGINRSNAKVNFTDDDPIDPKAQWLNGQHLRSMPVEQLAPYVEPLLREAGIPLPEDSREFLRIIDGIRSRFNSLHDFAERGRAYFSDDFPIDAKAEDRLNADGAREILRDLAPRLEALEDYTEPGIEEALRKLAEERGVKAGLIINAARAALSGQPVGPSIFEVFLLVGRQRSVRRLLAV